MMLHEVHVPYVVERRANVHHVENGGFAVLHSVAQNVNADLMARILIQEGNQTGKFNDGHTVRNFAEEVGLSAVLALF